MSKLAGQLSNGCFIAFILVMPPLSPSQYWSFFVISNGFIPGKAALKVNGNSQTVDGGLLLDGTSGYLSSHLSGQNALVNPGEFLEGFTFGLKLKFPASVMQYDNPRYILDTGEKSVNSPGVSLYLLNKKMVMEIATYDTRWKVSICWVSYLLSSKRTRSLDILGAASRFAHPEKLNLIFFYFVVGNPWQSFPSSTILGPLWLIVISLVFFYLSKLIFWGFLQFKGDSFQGPINSKYRDWPLRLTCNLVYSKFGILSCFVAVVKHFGGVFSLLGAMFTLSTVISGWDWSDYGPVVLSYHNMADEKRP